MASFLKNIISKVNGIAKNPVLPRILAPSSVKSLNFSHTSMPTPYEIVDTKETEEKDNLIKSDIVRKITEKIQNKRDPLFAVVHVAGKQFKITKGDIIVIEGYWPPDAGDKITLDKIMLVGAKEFSLIGRPLIQNDLVKVEATVIEKTLSHTKTHFRKKRRKQYKRINFYRIPQTMLQINDIKFIGKLNDPPDVTESKSRTL